MFPAGSYSLRRFIVRRRLNVCQRRLVLRVELPKFSGKATPAAFRQAVLVKMMVAVRGGVVVGAVACQPNPASGFNVDLVIRAALGATDFVELVHGGVSFWLLAA